MKYKLISFSLIAFVFLLSSLSMGAIATTNASSATAVDYTVNTSNQCTKPSTTLFVTGSAPDRYNVTSMSAPVNACVKVTFHNSDTIDHTFAIDAIAKDNVTYFNIYISGGQTKSLNFWTGNTSTALKYFCQVPGHEANGMYGTLNVGSSASSSSSSGSTPGFTLFSAVLALGMVVSYIKYTKRKR